MKTILKVIFSISIFTSGFTYSQTWPKYYSKPNNDCYSDDIIEMYDKGYLICGNYNGYFGSDFKQWSWLIKTDINGNILWEKIIEGGNEFIRTLAVEPTQDGGILTCGLIWTNMGYSDPYVMKLNPCGEKEWCKIFAGSTWELPWAQDIKELPSAEVIVLINQFEGNNAVDLVKLSSNGDLLWKKSYCKKSDYPDSDAPLGDELIITSSGDFFISGQVYWENPWGPNYIVYMRSLFMKVSETGIEEWVLPFGLQDTLLGRSYDAIEKTDGMFIGVGFYPEQVYYKGLIMQLDDFGNELNFSKIDAKSIDSLYNEVIFLGIGKFGEEYCLGGFIGVESGGNPTMETIVDSNLFNNPQFKYVKQYVDFIFPYVFGRTENKILSNSTYLSQNYWKITLSKLNLSLEYDTTNYGSLIYDSLCQPGPPQSGFIFLDDCEIITGTDIPSPEEYYSFIATIPITTYPNPASSSITLAFQNTDHHNNILLECYNIYGQRIHSEKVWKGQQETRIDLKEWAQGLYFAVVKSEGKVSGTCRFVKN